MLEQPLPGQHLVPQLVFQLSPRIAHIVSRVCSVLWNPPPPDFLLVRCLGITGNVIHHSEQNYPFFFSYFIIYLCTATLVRHSTESTSVQEDQA